MAAVIFKTGLQADFDALAVKDSNCLYFLTDTERIYKGNLLMGVGADASDVASGLLSAADKAALDALLAPEGKIEEIEGKIEEIEEELEKKVEKRIESSTGVAEIFNEADGGGAHYIHEDGSESFVGVNNGGEDGLMAQIYADVKDEDGNWVGSRINVYNDGIYYTSKADVEAGVQKNDPDHEIATKGDLKGIEGAMHLIGVVPHIEGNDDMEDIAAFLEEESITPENGDVLVMQNNGKEYVYANNEWREIGDEGLYETKAEAEASHLALQAAISAEESARIAADNLKVDKNITGTNGLARIFNEADGGGAKFEHNDGSEAFIGVNDGGKDGMMAQIYADEMEEGKWVGSRINVYHDHIYYTSYADVKNGKARNDEDCEIATKGDIAAASLEWGAIS